MVFLHLLNIGIEFLTTSSGKRECAGLFVFPHQTVEEQIIQNITCIINLIKLSMGKSN